jgi:hypothetical protein
MASLDDNFQELVERIRTGRDLSQTGFEPVYYLIFHPKEMLQVKRNMRAWRARLHNDGWDVHLFSMADAIQTIFASAPAALRRIWLMGDRKAPQNWHTTNDTNKSLADYLQKGQLTQQLGDALDALKGNPKAILLITDIEALHPYQRIGALEGKLTGRFCVPTVIFYPGTRAGKSQLRYLGFYGIDGNYRSQHVGG